MKNAYEVLQQKEAVLARTRHEIDCLRITALLLEEGLGSEHQHSQNESSAETSLENEASVVATGTEGLFSSFDSRRKFWEVLKRRR